MFSVEGSCSIWLKEEVVEQDIDNDVRKKNVKSWQCHLTCDNSLGVAGKNQ